MGKYTPERRREYDNSRYAKRRALAIEMLGGVCSKCGSTDRMEIDHVDRNKKEMTFEDMAHGSLERMKSELKKCQLLCHEHHVEKTVRERGFVYNGLDTHGSTRSYRLGCRCAPCRAAKADVQRRYVARKKLRDLHS